MNLHVETARNNLANASHIKSIFSKATIDNYELLSQEHGTYFFVTGLNKEVPIVSTILNTPKLADFIENLDQKYSYLLDLNSFKLIDNNSKTHELSKDLSDELKVIISNFNQYGGYINEQGEHVINLKTLPVGIHFGVNLLIGDRSKFDHPLQSTPKGVVDYLGRGSFRAHSTFQVLATSWGMRPEENGFPANRQFYLVEDNKQIFYSATIDDDVLEATCYHSTNNTRIVYKLKCGLEVTRTIFMSRQIPNGPCADEIQTIDIKNLLNKDRKIKIVYTGMFGSTYPDTQKIDIIYCTVIAQMRTFFNDKNEVVAITPDYYPEYCRREVRFASLRDDEGFASEYSSDYTQFVGRGSLDKPENLLNLQNRLSLKGPNFFALGKEINLKANKTSHIDTFTGMIDCTKTTGDDDLVEIKNELNTLFTKLNDHNAVKKEFNGVISDYHKYASFLQIDKVENENLKTYVNNNLPFQVYYQTFVSRAFAMTQKGYREIGFREIQDLYASMYYLVAQGKQKLLKELLTQWVENVYKMGYANHNFYYVGKEPGMCSDDQLWLIQAVSRYVNLTSDTAYLNKKVKMAGSNSKRTVYDTLKAIIEYSAKISVGKHNLPLLDSADWNDCLKIDDDYLNGPAKEKAYKAQLKKTNMPYGTRLESDYSESVMNAFLLVIGEKLLIDLAKIQKDDAYVTYLESLLKELQSNIQKHAYINDYFARVLVNKTNKNNIKYIGSKGDTLSIDPNVDGSYYLNSFSWSLLAKVASEEQISTMLDSVEKYLKTPAGFVLCSKHDLSRAGSKSAATDHYYQGDRENGGVFKHATMMSVVGMLQASKVCKNKDLQRRLLKNAYYMLDIVMPYRVLENPFKYKGNPRLCTQYNNSITEENIGPVLSGTSTWLTLAIMESLGVEIKTNGIQLSPALREEDTSITYSVKSKSYTLQVTIIKEKGQVCDNSHVSISVDSKPYDSLFIKDFNDNLVHQVVLKY